MRLRKYWFTWVLTHCLDDYTAKQCSVKMKKQHYKGVKDHTDCMCDKSCCATSATCSILVLCYSVIVAGWCYILNWTPLLPCGLVVAVGINNFSCLSFQLCCYETHKTHSWHDILHLVFVVVASLPTADNYIISPQHSSWLLHLLRE